MTADQAIEISDRLRGHVALVTGGSQGLGRFFAIDLAKQGMRVAVMARSHGHLDETVAEIHSCGGNAMAVAADVTDREAVEASINSIEENLGPIDLLVNAAGHVLPVGRTWEVDPDQWWRTMETNVKGTMNTCSVVARRMCPRKRGRIINVASSTVLHGRPYMSAYMTSKTAVVKMTEILAAELDEFGVKAFSIHPGTVDTDMAKTLRRPENAHWLRWFEEIFIKRLDNPPDLGSHLVQYLAAGNADDMSGRFFLVPLKMEETVSAFRQLASNSKQAENANLLRIDLLADTRPRHPAQEGI